MSYSFHSALGGSLLLPQVHLHHRARDPVADVRGQQRAQLRADGAQEPHDRAVGPWPGEEQRAIGHGVDGAHQHGHQQRGQLLPAARAAGALQGHSAEAVEVVGLAAQRKLLILLLKQGVVQHG